MWPFLEIAGLQISTNSLALALGVILGLGALFWAGRRRRMALAFLSDHFWLFFLLALIGGRAMQLLFYNCSLLDLPFFWKACPGFDFGGSLLIFLIMLAILTYRNRENFLSWLDLTTITFATVLIFFQIGNFLAGKNYGIPTDLPWGVVFVDPNSAVLTTLPIHPVQIYFGLFTFLVLILGMLIFKRTLESGTAGIFILLTLASGYFFLDFLRGDSAPTFYFLRISQIYALIFFSLAAGLLLKRSYKKIKNQTTEEVQIR